MQQPQPHRYTVNDYHRMGETGILPAGARVELIEGEIIDMTPIGSRHAGVVNRLNSVFSATLRGVAVVTVQNPVVLDERSEPQPDLALLRYRSDFYADAHPQAGDVLLIVEVADATLEYDRDIKLPLYARAGVTEVWLVDIAGKRVSTYRTPQSGRYMEKRVLTNLDSVEVATLPGQSFDLSDLFQ